MLDSFSRWQPQSSSDVVKFGGSGSEHACRARDIGASFGDDDVITLHNTTATTTAHLQLRLGIYFEPAHLITTLRPQDARHKQVSLPPSQRSVDFEDA